MKIEVSVPEIVSIFKEIQAQPEHLFDLIRHDIRERHLVWPRWLTPGRVVL